MRHLRITVDGRPYDVIVEDVPDAIRPVTGAPPPAAVTAPQPSAGTAPAAASSAPTPPPAQPAPSGPSSPASGGPDDRLAPLAGVVLEVYVSVGDTVEVDDQVVVLEAMKMKTVIGAHKAGRITGVHVKPGDAVDADQPLVTIQ
jgi:glutaconyl-CoA/methylmalonyl-CoA decarboxylase subunit gamma